MSLGPPFLELPPGTDIVWVDDAATWRCAQDRISKSSRAAIDTEWWDVGSGPALIQIAIHDAPHQTPTCFLVDTWHHEGSTGAAEFREVVGGGLVHLFTNADLQIIGWSFQEDAKRLKELCGDTACSCTFPVLDLQPICTLGATASTKSGCMEGLAVTCARFLGKPVDKSEQCSDWRQRPLSDAQRCYAALDALVLLELHSVLTQQV